MKEEIKKKLSELKGKYTGNPFDENNKVKLDFLAFVVEYYEQALNYDENHYVYKLEKIKDILKDNTNGV